MTTTRKENEREKKQQSHLIFPFQVCQVGNTVIAKDMTKCIDTNQYCCVRNLINPNAYLIHHSFLLVKNLFILAMLSLPLFFNI